MKKINKMKNKSSDEADVIVLIMIRRHFALRCLLIIILFANYSFKIK